MKMSVSGLIGEWAWVRAMADGGEKRNSAARDGGDCRDAGYSWKRCPEGARTE